MAIRQTFLASASSLRPLLEASGPRWAEPSALPEMSIGDLAAHAARAVSTVARYLDVETDQEATMDAAGYFLALPGIDDPGSETNRGVRRRAAAEAEAGPDAVVAKFDAYLADLAIRLDSEPTDRRVSVFGGLVLMLDDYLVTRLVEVVVHADDLAASLGVPSPDFSSDATGRVIDILVTVARHRHGDLSVIRAMTRRERDVDAALRVL